MEKVDLLIKNVNVFNSYLKKFVLADVSIAGEKFYYIDRRQDTKFDAEKIIDGTGKYMIPGLIDIHMHVESSMMTPIPFGECVAKYGVTTLVAEPHEIANVKGIRGILEMISAAQESQIDIYYGIPSSVPSTNDSLETSGAKVDFNDMKHLLSEKDVICVGEVMNYREIIHENTLEISRFISYLQQEDPRFIIEGHCPSLVDLDLAKFLYLGIDADHTEHTLEEFRQRIENGMFMEIQDKMLKPDILEYIKKNQLYEHCCFVTDDTMADTLYEKGQLNYVIQNAIDLGFGFEEAVYCGTFTPARRMKLTDRGTIAPGKMADFILLDSKNLLDPEMVFKKGKPVYEIKNSYKFPQDFYESIHLPEVDLPSFQISVGEEVDEVSVRAIEIFPDRTQTKEKLVTMKVKNHILQWKDSGCLLAMVFERHGKNGNIGYGFITGCCHKTGTVATTYFHDHHNLFVAGDDIRDMYIAVKMIQEMQGGILTLKGGNVYAKLALPVCGILSDQSLSEISEKLKAVRNSLIEFGYEHVNPIMSIATLGLPVSPALKLTDKGLIDVKEEKIVSLIVNKEK